MEKWWFDDDGVTEKSGANFAVVYFNSNGGTPQPYPFRVLYGDKVPRIRAVTHPNAILGFGGWIDESGRVWDMDTRLIKEQDDVDRDGIITLTARWSPNYVTVNFVTNYNQLSWGASGYPKNQQGETITVASQKIVPGIKIVEPPVLPTDGIHGLIGWFTEDGIAVKSFAEHNSINMNKKWNFENDIVTAPANTTITLYARWSTYSRTVHLQVNGGTRPNGQEVTRVNFTVFAGLGGVSGGKIIDPGPLVREGHTFAGWYTEAGVLWDFSTSRLNEVDVLEDGFLKNDAFILHARWVANLYYVNFNSNGGSPAPAMQTVAYGERALLPPIMTHPNTNMGFDGWHVGSVSGAEYDFDKPVTSNLTLVAKWSTKPFTVVFHLGKPNGSPPSNAYDSGMAPPQHFVGDGKAREPFMPSLPLSQINSAWSFYGWYASNDPQNDNQTKIDTINNANSQAVRDANLASAPWDFNNMISTGANSSNVLNLYARWAPPAPDMIWVSRGSFIMGDSGVSGSPAAYHSYPTRRVTLDGFYISRFEITQVSRADTNKS
ncbi:MAG: InlB B-repeat-containing protein, partial [Treponema sp.]|nr:InlB B-repeat-containing protein [Treponema sp.]